MSKVFIKRGDEIEYRNLGLDDRPDLIWNVDESGLPHEPKKCHVISAKGQKTLQVCKGLGLVAFTEA